MDDGQVHLLNGQKQRIFDGQSWIGELEYLFIVVNTRSIKTKKKREIFVTHCNNNTYKC